jgi:hypothetical protein
MKPAPPVMTTGFFTGRTMRVTLSIGKRGLNFELRLVLRKPVVKIPGGRMLPNLRRTNGCGSKRVAADEV